MMPYKDFSVYVRQSGKAGMAWFAGGLVSVGLALVNEFAVVVPTFIPVSTAVLCLVAGQYEAYKHKTLTPILELDCSNDDSYCQKQLEKITRYTSDIGAFASQGSGVRTPTESVTWGDENRVIRVVNKAGVEARNCRGEVREINGVSVSDRLKWSGELDMHSRDISPGGSGYLTLPTYELQPLTDDDKVDPEAIVSLRVAVWADGSAVTEQEFELGPFTSEGKWVMCPLIKVRAQ